MSTMRDKDPLKDENDELDATIGASTAATNPEAPGTSQVSQQFSPILDLEEQIRQARERGERADAEQKPPSHTIAPRASKLRAIERTAKLYERRHKRHSQTTSLTQQAEGETSFAVDEEADAKRAEAAITAATETVTGLIAEIEQAAGNEAGLADDLFERFENFLHRNVHDDDLLDTASIISTKLMGAFHSRLVESVTRVNYYGTQHTKMRELVDILQSTAEKEAQRQERDANEIVVLSTENEKMKAEIEALRQQLASSNIGQAGRTSHPAMSLPGLPPSSFFDEHCPNGVLNGSARDDKGERDPKRGGGADDKKPPQPPKFGATSTLPTPSRPSSTGPSQNDLNRQALLCKPDPKFDGNRDKNNPEKGVFDIWWEPFEIVCGKADANTKLQILLNSLTGPARSYYSCLPKDCKSDYSLLTKRLSERYCHTLTDQQLEEKWNNLSMLKGEAFDRFITRLSSIATVKTKMEKKSIDDMAMKKKLLFGLPDLARDRVLLRYAEHHKDSAVSFDDYVTLARPIVLNAMESSITAPPPPRSRYNRPSAFAVTAEEAQELIESALVEESSDFFDETGDNGDNNDAMMDEGETVLEVFAATGAPVECFNCKEQGHSYVTCTKPRTPEGQKKIDNFKLRIEEIKKRRGQRNTQQKAPYKGRNNNGQKQQSNKTNKGPNSSQQNNQQPRAFAVWAEPGLQNGLGDIELCTESSLIGAAASIASNAAIFPHSEDLHFAEDEIYDLRHRQPNPPLMGTRRTPDNIRRVAENEAMRQLEGRPISSIFADSHKRVCAAVDKSCDKFRTEKPLIICGLLVAGVLLDTECSPT